MSDALPPDPDELPALCGEELASGSVTLQLDRKMKGDPTRGFVPYYHFRILAADGLDIGYINFRVGDTDHITQYAGHIGFEIKECF